jgi:ankyrin repeat protein
MNQQTEAARILLAVGADPNVRDDEGDTLLGLCLKHGDLQTAQLLKQCAAKAH